MNSLFNPLSQNHSKLRGRETWENLEVAKYWQNVGKAYILRDLYKQ